MTIDYAKQIDNLGRDLTNAERQLAIINGIQNNLGILIEMVQRLEHRVNIIEEKINE